MGTRISSSAVKIYSECGTKYRYHYLERLRASVTSGALLFGSAVDQSLNELLTNRDLNASLVTFDKAFTYADINKVGTYLPTSTNIVYAQKDFDKDLLLDSDREEYNQYKEKNKLNTHTTIEEDQSFLADKKKDVGHHNFTEDEKKLYAYGNWLSMRRKGHIMVKSYHDVVLPKIKQVLAVQKQISLTNGDGDEIIGYLDIIVEFHDGKRYLLDNKTSYMKYDFDSPMKSQQLILYHHAAKDEYKLDGVGFVVLYKAIDKNKVKSCSKCHKNGTGQRHKTCDAEDDHGERCNGAWNEKIDPECKIDILLSPVTQAAENLVIETFDRANEGIKKQIFTPNLFACKINEAIICQFVDLCWKGKDDGLVKV